MLRNLVLPRFEVLLKISTSSVTPLLLFILLISIKDSFYYGLSILRLMDLGSAWHLKKKNKMKY